MKLYGYYHNSKTVSIKQPALFSVVFCLFSVRDAYRTECPVKHCEKQDDPVPQNKRIMFDKRQYFIIII